MALRPSRSRLAFWLPRFEQRAVTSKDRVLVGAVNIAEPQSLRGFAPQHVELVSKDKDLGLPRSPRPEQSDQGAADQSAEIAHRG
jgi:hypothetical protein